jgi:pilus assembly protein Flp/PilA
MLKTYIAATTALGNVKDRLARDESGASLVEYSILIGLISVAAITAILAVGGWVSDQWTALQGKLGA